MSKCNICGTEQKQIGEGKISCGDKQLGTIPIYNITILTYIKGKNICENCMNTYRKISALMDGWDFSCGGNHFYADGRNLE